LTIHSAGGQSLGTEVQGCSQEMAEDSESAAELYNQAVSMLPQRNLAIEAVRTMQKAGKSQEVIDMYEKLPQRIKNIGRIRVTLVEALLDMGDINRAERILNGNIQLTDVREGK
jgi:thioredoxin-like negative regulator of GroEL